MSTRGIVFSAALRQPSFPGMGISGKGILMIALTRPLIGQEEKEAVLQVLSSGRLAQGEYVEAFERYFARQCEVQEAIAVSSGTAALYLALLAHNIGPGDEVITTSFGFVATANAIVQAGATPVFVDIEPETYTIDPALVEAAITSRTKAILPVHLYGNPCRMSRLLQIAEAHHLIIIENACQAHAASIKGKPVGSFGTGCFSFHATKNMTTGEGGMVTTNDPAIAKRIRSLRDQGQHADYPCTEPGYNLRMTDIQGALGLAQLKHLERYTEQRIANAAFLTERLRGAVQTPIAYVGYRHVYHRYTIQVPAERDQWVRNLQERGISTAVLYPLPIHLQPFYKSHTDKFRCVGWTDKPSRPIPEGEGQLPITEKSAQYVLSLPVHPALSKADLITIAQEVLNLCS
jgi:perosamine synthetase